jgi:hypothetical protein
VRVTSAPSTGVLEVSLTDGGGVILTDDEGNDNKITVDLTTVGTTFVAKGASFRTPSLLPATAKLRIRLTTALENTKGVLIDHMALTPMAQLYPGGPSVAFFSTPDLAVSGDTWTVTVANDRAGEFQEYFERFFGMAQLGLILPSDASGSETIADTLIS